MPNKEILLYLNWKMQPSNRDEALELLDEYAQLFEGNTPKNHDLQTVFFPPTTYLAYAQMAAEVAEEEELEDMDSEELSEDFVSSFPEYGVQDICEFEPGAHTGQTSSAAAASLGCNYALIGHSETRLENSLSNQNIATKITQALKNELSPVVCLGYSDNKEGVNLVELKEQAKSAIEPNLQLIMDSKDLQFILAYEPVWAIGTGKTASPEIVTEVLGNLKTYLTETFGKELATKTKLLYGGSVSADNALELAKIDNLDGFLVGKVSLDIDKLRALVEVF